MPFDAADSNWRDHPAPIPSRWEGLNNLLHSLALLATRTAVLGIMLIFVAYVVAVATGGSPDCVVHVPSLACR